ncbi:PREDICTED: uncharacterized protein LOC108374705 isoform X2 [Rhagoletis zephyria]|uniref:uncharacterized protein LOC108374705 isoform X2 n=1 Tax=Rhagoletis zephyria TaxID=28612 RepID=UPI0008112CAB|nr:PREDICTED: uncharacterized protein LOC108374705 isoform X2 [Rhagoletis zephyria]
MNISVFFYSSSSYSDNEVRQVQIRRGLRGKSNPLSLPAAAFKKRFRLSKPAFEYVLSELEFEGHMSTSVPSVLQLAATLSLLQQQLLGRRQKLFLFFCRRTNRI